jgi:hypothetical protein
MWPLQVDLYSVEHDDAGQAAFNAHDCEDFPLPLLEWLA